MPEQIERKISITYRWWKDGEVKEEHVKDLEEAARDRIMEMTKEGYTSGELCATIGTDEVEYTGWWELKEECL